MLVSKGDGARETRQSDAVGGASTTGGDKSNGCLSSQVSLVYHNPSLRVGLQPCLLE